LSVVWQDCSVARVSSAGAEACSKAIISNSMANLDRRAFERDLYSMRLLLAATSEGVI
jgi:hypothetical protein